jgi:hypothetical protein
VNGERNKRRIKNEFHPPSIPPLKGGRKKRSHVIHPTFSPFSFHILSSLAGHAREEIIEVYFL